MLAGATWGYRRPWESGYLCCLGLLEATSDYRTSWASEPGSIKGFASMHFPCNEN